MQSNQEAARTPLVRMRAALRLQYYIMNVPKAKTLAGKNWASEASRKRSWEHLAKSSSRSSSGSNSHSSTTATITNNNSRKKKRHERKGHGVAMLPPSKSANAAAS